MGKIGWWQKQSGHGCFWGHMPEDWDPEETTCEIEFDWALSEPQTRDYPGSPGYVHITSVRPCSAPEIDIDTMTPELLAEFTRQAEEWFNRSFVLED